MKLTTKITKNMKTTWNGIIKSIAWNGVVHYIFDTQTCTFCVKMSNEFNYFCVICIFSISSHLDYERASLGSLLYPVIDCRLLNDS